MKIRSLFLATAFVLTAGAALAQSNMTGTPTGQAGSKTTESTTSNTMSKDTMAKDKMMNKDHATTGAAANTTTEVSPASPNAGGKPEK